TVVWDRETGIPVYNAIVWQCRRTTQRCEALKAQESDIKRRTGLFVDPYFSATKVEWILDNVPDGRARAEAGALCFGTIDTWILWKLTGGRVHATEPSNASRTLLMDISERQFSADLLNTFNIPASMLPELHDSDDLHGYVDSKWIGKEVPIHAILGDQQASLFAHAGWRQGVVKNTYGTGLFLMAATGEDLPESGRLLNTVAWQTGGKVTYAIEGSVFAGGAAVQWLRDGLELIDDADETQALAESLDGNDDVYFVPALSGLGAPYWDPNARGTIIGLTRQTTRAHLARATLEAIAYQSRDVIDAFASIVPDAEFDRLRVDGGACRNDFLMQFQADLLQRPVIRPKILESTALGSAGLAAIACGFWTREAFADINGPERVFEPLASAADMDTLYTRWLQAVERSRMWKTEP
ncbi:MAG: glycerol kinase GlpK, partial [Kiritimatiellae bacterium]|nr:glycerol kinase GlpK [Kiritimatiellia bacterium]